MFKIWVVVEKVEQTDLSLIWIFWNFLSLRTKAKYRFVLYSIREKQYRDSFEHNRQNTQERLRESEQREKVCEIQLNSCYRVGEKEKRGGGGCVCPPRWWVNICVCVCVSGRMYDLGACASTWQSPSRLQITLSLLSITRLSNFPVFFSFFFIFFFLLVY